MQASSHHQGFAARLLTGLGCLAVFGALLLPHNSVRAQMMLDDFEDVSGWSATSSDGSDVWIVQETGHTGQSLRIGFDLNSGGGFIIVRKEFALPLPANYAFSFYLRGEAPQNNFELKLIDSTGKNVWWRKQRDFVFPTEWQPITIRKSRFEFAWGPSNGRELKRVGAIEFAISAGSGGKGSIWIDDLTFEEREPSTADGVTPTITASTAVSGHEPALMLDQDANTSWKSEATPATQSVLIDLLRNREYGGLVIDWEPEDYATSYQVQTSIDGEHWTEAYSTASGVGGRDYIYMPDAESRYIRLDLQRSNRGQGYGIATITLKPFEFSASPNRFFAAIAQDTPVGNYPKYFYGNQTYWTVIGVNGDDKEALLNEEGMLEVDRSAFSIDPFLYADGRLITWNDVQLTQELDDGYLPIPSVTRRHERLDLRITAFAGGLSGASTLYAIYRVTNHSDAAAQARLFLTIRPFQVNPPWQSLNMTGGITTIRQIRQDGQTVWVNRDQAVVSLTTPDAFGAATFEQGAVTDALKNGKVPVRLRVSDPFGFASSALQYNVDLQPHAHADVYLAIPFHDAPAVAAALDGEDAPSLVSEQLENTRRYWRTTLGRVEFQLPPEAEKIVRTLKTTLAYILINRDGPALQPGSRSYARSWIRDGAFSSTALLQLGCTQEVRDFVRWYARQQQSDGKVPCCVDRKGPDAVPENDSNGEFIFAVAEYYRYTHDVGFLNDMWPYVTRAVDYLSALRRKRMTPAYRTPEKEAFFGLLPESISHEGYTAHPVHSYWDDFFALRGLKDAATLATALGDDERAASIATLRDEFRKDLYASIGKTMVTHGIDYIPGSVELGDLDPSSTAVALVPSGELANLPQPALSRTFERYYDDFTKRRSGAAEYESYTPYELRNVDALIRLGQRERAFEVLTFMLADQRPLAWNEWAEVVWRDPAAARFIGDMPHTWVGATFITAVRSMFAYEREADRALVLAAGLPSSWITSESGVAVKRLPTPYGVLNYSLQRNTTTSWRLKLSGDLNLPPGQIVVEPPLPQPLRAVTVNGKPLATFRPDSATINEFPADIVLEFGPEPKE